MTLEGQILGDYRILRELGRGGMGVVYLADQVSLGRRVALKVLPKGQSLSPGALARFRREAEAASRLDHPAICAIHATGIHEGIPYIAMRYVEGQPLSQMLLARRRARTHPEGREDPETFRFDVSASTAGDSRTLLDASGDAPTGLEGKSTPTETTSTSRQEIRWAVALAEKVARALHTAHEARIIHRDIKPGNIMVAADDQPVILDFGLARSLEGSEGPGLTQSGEVMGTPQYMSPEQISGQGTVDARTDVYSLGVTLYELVAGRRPFEAPNRERLYRAILNEEAPPAGRFNGMVERDLEIVIATALERDLNRRYQTAQALADDLRAVLTHQPIAARPLSPLLRLRKWARRNPAVAVGLAAAFVLLAGGLWETYFYARRIEAERDLVRQEMTRADRELAAKNAALEGRNAALRRSRAMRLAAEAQALAALEPALALNLALAAAELEGSPEVDRALRLTLAASPEERRFPAPSLEEGRAPLGEGLPGSRLLPGPGGLPAGGPSRNARLRDQFSPSGDVHWPSARVATLSDDPGGIPLIWDIATGRLISVLAGHVGQVFTVRFSPDGRRAVTSGDDGTARLFDTATGEILRVLRDPGGRWGLEPAVLYAEFDASGNLVLTVTGDREVVVWDAERGTVLWRNRRYRVEDGPPLARFHPFLPWVASAATSRVLVWIPGVRGEVEFDDPASSASVRSMAFCPVGTPRMATGDREGNVVIWGIPTPPWRRGASPVPLARLRAHESEVRVLAFSPDGSRLASGSGDRHVTVWELEGTPRLQATVNHTAPVLDLEWSPDGNQLVSASADRTAQILDLRTEQVILRFQGHPDWVNRVVYSEDGGHLVTWCIDGTARLHSLRTPGEDLALDPMPREVSSVEWCPQGRCLICVSRDGSCRLLDLDEGARQHTLLLESDDQVRAIRFLTDSDHVALMRNVDPWLILHRPGSPLPGEWSLSSDVGAIRLSPSEARSTLVLTPDRTTALGVGPGGIPVIIRTAGSILQELRHLRAQRHALAAHPAGRGFLIWPEDQEPVMVEPATGAEVLRFSAPGPTPRASCFSPDGKSLLLLSLRGAASVLDAESGAVRWSLGEQTVMPVWIQEGRMLATAPHVGPVKLLGASDGQEVENIPLEGTLVRRLLASPNEEKLLIFSAAELLIWDLPSRRWQAALRVGSADLEDWDLSPDGQRLALGFADGSVRIIHLDPVRAATRKSVRPPTSAEMERFELGTPEARIASQQEDLTIRRRIELEALAARARFQPEPGNLLAYAQRILNRRDPVPERFAESLQLAELAVFRTARRNPEALHVLAWSLFRNQRPSEAVETVQEALGLLPPEDPSRGELESSLNVFQAPGS